MLVGIWGPVEVRQSRELPDRAAVEVISPPLVCIMRLYILRLYHIYAGRDSRPLGSRENCLIASMFLSVVPHLRTSEGVTPILAIRI